MNTVINNVVMLEVDKQYNGLSYQVEYNQFDDTYTISFPSAWVARLRMAQNVLSLQHCPSIKRVAFRKLPDGITICHLVRSSGAHTTGMAKCKKGDVYSENIGHAIALARAMNYDERSRTLQTLKGM